MTNQQTYTGLLGILDELMKFLSHLNQAYLGASTLILMMSMLFVILFFFIRWPKMFIFLLFTTIWIGGAYYQTEAKEILQKQCCGNSWNK